MFQTTLLKVLLISITLKGADLTIPQIPCPFNTNCTCTPPDGPNFLAICYLNEPVFPTFTEYNDLGVSEILIDITYLQKTGFTIPNNAFYPLKSMNSATIGFSTIYTNCWNSPQLAIASGAFNTDKPDAISTIFFANVNIPVLPTGTFDRITVQELQFPGTCLGVINDNAFSGLNVNALQVGDITSPMSYGYAMSPLVLNGITFRGNNSQTSFTYLPLTDQQWPTFKLVNSVNLMLNNNNFTSVPNFAFCNCSTSSCPNNILQSINLANNNIQTNVFGNAFANLPNLQYLNLSSNNIDFISSQMENALSQLKSLLTLDLSHNQLQTLTFGLDFAQFTWLSLAYNQLVSVPQQLSSSLQYLDLSNNQIAEIIPNNFNNVRLLQQLNVDNNPIAAIDPGAFWGLNSMTGLSFQFLKQMNSLDLLITYGMANVTSFAFTECALETVVLSDLSKLPSTLSQIHLTEMITLKEIDQSVQGWLAKSEKNFLDVSLNVLGCNQDFQWMAKYAVCQPIQINSVDSKCTNGTLFYAFLHSFQPSC